MSDKLRNLIVRAASGAVLLIVVLAAAFLGRYGFAALLLVISLVGMKEYYAMAAAVGAAPQRCLGIVTGVALFAAAFIYYESLYVSAACVPQAAIWCAVIVLLMVVASFVVEIFRHKEHPMANVAQTLLGVIYVALPMSLMLFVPYLLGGAAWRPEVFLFYLFIVWGNDVFAYLVGVAIGRHRLCERISPKKSWEGFFGGIAGAMAMGMLGAYVTCGDYLLWLGLAFVVAIMSVLGDLVESMFKREAGIKDSGNIIPGHGGMLDRFDALIISAPAALIYLLVVELLKIC